MSASKTIIHSWPTLDKTYELFRTSDEHGDISVHEYKKFRTLVFDDGIFEQSRIRIDDPLFLDHEYAIAMLLPLLKIKPKHTTLLGLGGGAMASCLYYLLHDAKISVVELRQAVIDVAYEYCHLPKDDRLATINKEAGAYLESVENGSTDLIISDLYHATRMDDVQLEEGFYERCYRALTKEGWLSINYLKSPSVEEAPGKFLCQYFPSVFLLKLHCDNWIVVACKKEMRLPELMMPLPMNHLPASMETKLRQLQGRLHKMNASKK